ncbi:MAG: spore germination protein [Clostridia bacterium]|nr:spore germination protein [Clostridia bacterium]
MIQEGKIGVFEASSLVIFMVASKALFGAVRELVEATGPSAWYTTIISGITALIGFWIIIRLMQRFPGQELVSILKTVYGRITGSLIALIICFLYIYNAASFTREFTEAVKVFEYPLTPPSFIMILILLAVIVLLYYGLETTARTTSFFTWPLIVGMISIFFLGLPLGKLTNLYPLLGHGLDRTIITGLLRSSVYGEVIGLTIILNALQGIENFKKAGKHGIIISIIIISLSLFIYSLIFPYSVSVENTIPLLTLTRIIEYGRFFQRFESIYIFIWSVAATLTTAINLYLALSIYCKTFRINDHRVLVLPLCILLFSIAIIPKDIVTITSIYVHYLRQYGWIIFIGLPLLTLIVAAVRGKKGESANA